MASQSDMKDLLESYLSGHPSFKTNDLRKFNADVWEKSKNDVRLPGLNPKTEYRTVQKIVQDGNKSCVTIAHESYIVPRLKRTQAEAVELYKSYRIEWLASPTYKLLKAHLDKIAFPPINKIICFALGTPSNLDDEGRRRSNIQHAAVESLIQILREKTGGNKVISCYAQEPLYDNSDRALLKTIDIEKMDDPEGPEGFLEVDENTLVVSMGANIPVRMVVADLVWPAAMLWDTVQSIDTTREQWKSVTLSEQRTTEPESPRLQMLVKSCNQGAQYPLQDVVLRAFPDVTLYVRKVEKAKKTDA